MTRIALAITVMFCSLFVACDDNFNRDVLPGISLGRFATNGVLLNDARTVFSHLQRVLFKIKYYRHTGTMIRPASHLRMCLFHLTLSPCLQRQTPYWLLLSPIEISHLVYHSQRWQPTLLARTTPHLTCKQTILPSFHPQMDTLYTPFLMTSTSKTTSRCRTWMERCIPRTRGE